MRTLPPRLRRPAATALVVLATAAGCAGGDAPTAPPSTAPPAPRAALSDADGARRGGGQGQGRGQGEGRGLLACATTHRRSAGARIGPEGGVIELGDVTVALPPGAVAQPQRFTVSVVPGDVLAVDVHAEGHDGYRFERPIAVTIAYGRCGDVAGDLTAWHVDEADGTLLEHMGGVTDRERRTHSFTTPHLSVYALAN